jgi:putative membrane protein
MHFLIRVLAAALGFWIATRLVHGVHVHGLGALLLAGLVLGVLNALVRPVITLLTLPLTIVTLGLFLFVVNGLTVWMVAFFIREVHIAGLWPAILTSVIISLTSWFAAAVLAGDDR